jgi:hypothetical protein
MKTFKTIFAALILAALTTAATAQENVNATASAQVVVELDVEKLQDINFGDVALNATAVLDVVGGAHENVSGAAVSVGKFSVTATQYASIDISWTNTTLAHSTEDLELDYTPAVARTTDEGATTGEPFTAGEIIANEADYFLIGGSLVVPTGANAGTYEGTFTLTAEIN